MAYLLNLDVIGHEGGADQAVTMLVEIDRRIRAFQAEHRRPFRFTIIADHGNAHQRATLVDPRQILREVGVTPVETLSDRSGTSDAARPATIEAVPIVHVRVNYVAVHAAEHNVVAIAARSSTHPYVDLAVARLATISGPAENAESGSERFGVWRQGELFAFRRDQKGTITVEEPDRWTWLGVDLQGEQTPDAKMAVLADREAFVATAAGPYPDLFYRVATAFTHSAARFPAEVLLSMPDDVASYGFETPGAVDIRAVDGFHGSLSRGSTLSVVASQDYALPPSVRSDDLADLFPVLGGKTGGKTGGKMGDTTGW